MRKPFIGDWEPTRGFHGPLIENDAKYGRHKGIDWPLPTGTPLLAAITGTVVWASPAPDAGNTVTIQARNGLIVKCFHLASIAVHLGQRVFEGQLIGMSGATGNVTGPHLHFQVERGGVAIDPAPLLTKEGEVMKPTPHDVSYVFEKAFGRPARQDELDTYSVKETASWPALVKAVLESNELLGRVNGARVAEVERYLREEMWPKLGELQTDVKVMKDTQQQLDRIEAMLKEIKGEVV